MSDVRARGPRQFTRRWWLNGLYTFAWVSIITILVWTYADQEFTTDRELVVTVRLTTGRSTSRVLKSLETHKITVRIQGNRNAVDRLAPGEGKAPLEVTYDVSKVADLGRSVLDAATIIDEGLGIGEAHLSILSVSPAFIDVELGRPELPVRAALSLAADASSELFLTSAPSVPVEFTLEGDRAALKEFAQVLSDAQNVLAFDVSKGLGQGKHEIRTDKLLAGHKSIAGTGLTVHSCTPEVIAIELDKLVKQTVKVKFRYTGATLAGPEEITPPQVTILVGEASWQAIKAKQADPVIHTVATDLTGAKTVAGVGTLKVALSQEIEGLVVKPLVSTVEVKFRIAGLTVEKELRVHVRVLAPPEWSETGGIWTRYILVRKEEQTEWWPTITFKGSQRDLEQLSTPKIDAYIKLEDGDEKKVDSWLAKTVIIQLPPDLSVDMVGPAPEVKCKLQERPGTPATP